MVDLTEIYKKLGIEIESPELEFIPDIYLNKIIDVIAINKNIVYRIDLDYEEPYMFSCEHIQTINKNKDQALIDFTVELINNKKLTQEQCNNLFYIISYLG